MATKFTINSQAIADQLHSLAIHLLRKLRREDAEGGLNAPRLSALSVLVFAGPLTLGDLAAAEQVRPPTMTRIVDALVELELAIKTRNASDARSTLIAATPAGRKLLLAARERRVRALTRQIANLAPGEQAALQQAIQTLKKIVAAI
jgi:DNA-binding MarR family transcriptional regulator